MEFKYRAIDQQAAPYVPNQQPSSFTYFTEQALRAGYSSTNLLQTHEVIRNHNNVREIIKRELEKEQIREEIIALEIARRHALEAEVRREMLMEREMALRRENFPFISSSSSSVSMMRFEPNRYNGRLLEERIALSLGERLGYSAAAPHAIGGLEMVPFHCGVVEPKISEIGPPRPSVEPKISELKPVSEDSKDKEKIILLANSDANRSGQKRKTVMQTAVGCGESTSGAACKKKIKEEWSCALCQVSVTSETGLNGHLHGKKHKAREAGLREGKTEREVLQVNKKRKASLKKILVLEKQNGASLLPINKETDDSMEKNGEAVEKVQKNGDNKKRCRFWCEMCQIGAYSEKVMEAHKNGKKHMIRLQEVNQNGGSNSTTPMVEATKGMTLRRLPMMEKKEASARQRER